MFFPVWFFMLLSRCSLCCLIPCESAEMKWVNVDGHQKWTHAKCKNSWLAVIDVPMIISWRVCSMLIHPIVIFFLFVNWLILCVDFLQTHHVHVRHVSLDAMRRKVKTFFSHRSTNRISHVQTTKHQRHEFHLRSACSPEYLLSRSCSTSGHGNFSLDSFGKF